MPATSAPRESWDLLSKEAEGQLVDVRTEAEWNFVGVPDLSPLEAPGRCSASGSASRPGPIPTSWTEVIEAPEAHELPQGRAAASALPVGRALARRRDRADRRGLRPLLQHQGRFRRRTRRRTSPRRCRGLEGRGTAMGSIINVRNGEELRDMREDDD